ncbi:MAG: nicotinate-nucleotide--dimethylbenzimidazole phosphoribosyltransferase [Pseudomonadota bacterium]
MFNVTALDTSRTDAIQTRIDNKTKPAGSLGVLEPLAMRLALITGDTITLKKPTILLFAGDHGVAAEGVSIAPSEVTQLMVQNFLSGGAAINCFARQLGWELAVIDAGILTPVEGEIPNYHQQRVGNGTGNLAVEPAMTTAQANQSLELGASMANQRIRDGSNLIACGEMGIGNSTSAAAIAALLLDCTPKELTGRGTGINDQQLQKKVAAIEAACDRAASNDPLNVLSEVGGFEIGQMAGAMLATAKQGAVVLVDGFIATAAALIATRIAPASRDYMVFAHCSHEQGHQLMLDALQATPLLDLKLRLGEGTGAALALPLLQAAATFYNDMASLDAANIELP